MLGHEYTIANRVNDLLKHFGITQSVSPDIEAKLVEYLQANRSSTYTPAQTVCSLLSYSTRKYSTPLLWPSPSPLYLCHHCMKLALHQAKVKISEQCGGNENAQRFNEKYEELKGKNVRDLDSLVMILSKVISIDEIRNVLNSTTTAGANKRASTFITDNLSLNSSSSVGSAAGLKNASSGLLSAQQLAEMKEKVLKNVNSGTSIQNLSNTLFMQNKSNQSQLQLQQQHQQHLFNTAPKHIDLYSLRPYLSWDFYPNPQKFEADSDVSKMSLASQEESLIDDLLNCMTGIEGKYIKTPSLIDSHAERTFHIDRSLDSALRDLAKRILPLCSYYSIIIRFVEEKSNFKWGLVNHALCSSIRELLKNHTIFVSQLETMHRDNQASLSLQKLWYYTSPIIQYMEVLAAVVKIINKGECKGSMVIDILYDKLHQYSGDEKLRELIYYMLSQCCKPYLHMLYKWLYNGNIKDPYCEFMIIKDTTTQIGVAANATTSNDTSLNDIYWERKYAIKRENTPKFLEFYSNKILLTGKYLNAVNVTNTSKTREEQQQDEKEQEKQQQQQISHRMDELWDVIEFNLKDEYYKLIVDNAYNHANKLLLDLLLNKYKLIQRLKSLKHYFLMDQSDFMVHFMDISEDEMKKEQNEIKLNRLESLLELSLRITSANSDPYKDDLKVKLFSCDLKTLLEKVTSIGTTNEIQGHPITTNLSGLESFSLDYVVKWPLSLVINRMVLLNYQILFRHIFYIKHVERQLCNVWLCTKSGEYCLSRNSKYYSLACALKQRMINFIQNLLNYITFEVFETNWSQFEQTFQHISNIDDLIKSHTEFLKQCLHDCMLTNYKNFRYLDKLFGTCLMFTDYLQQLSSTSTTIVTTATSVNEDLNKLISDDDFGKVILNYDKTFSQLLLNLLAQIMNDMSENREHCKIINIVNRLDFNDHYREQLEKLRQAKTNENKENLLKLQNTLDTINLKLST